MRILYVCGIVGQYPLALRPLPPLDSGAPHHNIMRLLSGIENFKVTNNLSIDVVSALEPGQDMAYRKLLQNAEYRKVGFIPVTIPKGIRQLSAWCRDHLPWSQGILRRVFKATSIQDLFYIWKVIRKWKRREYDYLLLDDGPQFIRGLSRSTGLERCLFYCRGDMGRSREDLHLVKTVFATNEELAKWVRSQNDLVYSTYVVTNTISDSLYSQLIDFKRPTTGPKYIVFAGRITPEKGVIELLNAFILLRQGTPKNESVVLLIAGGSDVGSEHMSSYEESVRKFAEKSLPEGACIWLGWQSQQELLGLYRKAHVAVFPSTCIEGFGMVAIEAMSCGCPVVASNRPGFRTLLKPDRGILVDDPCDRGELAVKIQSVLEDSKRSEKFARRAHASLSDYSEATAIRQFVDFFK